MTAGLFLRAPSKTDLPALAEGAWTSTKTRANIGGMSEGLEAAIAARASDWRKAADAAGEDLRSVTGLVIAATAARQADQALATQAIFLQAANDFTDLICDASQGRGRPALRSARSLFEHHIAALDVNADSDLAARWLDHLPIAEAAESELTLIERHLRGNRLKGYRHRTRKLAAASIRQKTEATSKWGPSFARQWNPRTLYARADDHGLAEHYAFYRFASAPVHGSRGGLIGLQRTVKGFHVLRHGPAIAVTPHAVLYGTASMRAIVDLAASYVPAGLQRTVQLLDALEALWDSYYEALIRLDDELWPADPPPSVCALQVLEASGQGSWYEYQPAMELARLALSDHVSIHPAQKSVFDTVLAATTGIKVGICLYDAVVSSPSSNAWVDARTLLDEAPIGIRSDGTVEVPRHRE